MSKFEVLIDQISDVKPHDNADKLELVYVRGYQCVTQKNKFTTGDLVAYIPDGSIVPYDIIKYLDLENKLVGSKKNRVKMIKLRGYTSLGLLYPVEAISPISKAGHRIFLPDGRRRDVVIGDDVAEFLGITKYEPPIPTQLAGEVYNAGTECTISYDIENWKKYPNIIKDGEEVVMTEKIHGTCFQFGIMNSQFHNQEHFKGTYLVASKGLGGQGFCFKHNDANKNNVYLRAAHKYKLFDIIDEYEACTMEQPLFILGEVYGAGIQDLKYGCDQGDIKLRIFDVAVGMRGTLRYFNDAELGAFCDTHNLDRVPVLYRGPFSREVLELYTNGKESVSGTQANIREGVVMRPVIERYDYEIGRVQLKNVSEDYLLRKNGTENQ